MDKGKVMSAIIYPKWLEKRWADEKADKEYKAETKRLYYEYYENHAACPECGNDDMEVTTMASGPSLNQRGGPDRNRASCKCGWRGIVDDRVPIKIRGQQSSSLICDEVDESPGLGLVQEILGKRTSLYE